MEAFKAEVEEKKLKHSKGTNQFPYDKNTSTLEKPYWTRSAEKGTRQKITMKKPKAPTDGNAALPSDQSVFYRIFHLFCKKERECYMKKIVSLLLTLAFVMCFCSAPAEEAGILGKRFPDFTVMDTEGSTFALSEKLQNHEAVLINIWATWCPPCGAEMAFLNEAYEQYKDRVAFIALSCEENDTPESIAAYRVARGLSFPMGCDEGAALYQYIGEEGIPTTVIVDRFGNAAFLRSGSFFSAGDISRVIEAFLGDDYTKTAVLTEIPKDASTRAFPVSSTRAIHVENENIKGVLFWVKGNPDPQPAYVIQDAVAHLRLEIAAADDPAAVFYYNYSDIFILQILLDAERNAYVFDQPMPDADAESHYVCGLLTKEGDTGDDAVAVYLIPGEEYIEELAEAMRSWGYDVTWEYGDYAWSEATLPQSYLLHIVDQDGAPVPGVFVTFCTDTACVMKQSDENGTVTFDGAPDVYHVQLIKVPDGYSFDSDFELYTARAYGEWLLRIRKNGDAAALSE